MTGYRSKVAMMSNNDGPLDNMGLTISSGRAYGIQYHCVHPGPFWEMKNNLWHQMMQWNIDTFGPTPMDGVWTPNARWYANDAKFWFQHEKDLTMFILRWS